MKVLRGQVWWINFDPSVGSEIRKMRPAVVISNDRSNDKLERYQVLPLSTQVKKIYPTEVLISFKGKASKAMADQLTTVRACLGFRSSLLTWSFRPTLPSENRHLTR
jgi:mRNA interferase MazF